MRFIKAVSTIRPTQIFFTIDLSVEKNFGFCIVEADEDFSRHFEEDVIGHRGIFGIS